MREHPDVDLEGRVIRAAIYARCSTSEQDFTRQLEEYEGGKA